jgi:hypothetical protein
MLLLRRTAVCGVLGDERESASFPLAKIVVEVATFYWAIVPLACDELHFLASADFAILRHPAPYLSKHGFKLIAPER